MSKKIEILLNSMTAISRMKNKPSQAMAALAIQREYGVSPSTSIRIAREALKLAAVYRVAIREKP